MIYVRSDCKKVVKISGITSEMDFNDINKIDCDIASFRIGDNGEVDTNIAIKYNESIEEFIDIFKDKSYLELRTYELSLDTCTDIHICLKNSTEILPQTLLSSCENYYLMYTCGR
jgi:hypothetical protein